MTALLSGLLGQFWPYIVGGIGIAGTLLAGWLRAKAIGRKEQREKQAAAEAKAVASAKQVQTQVDALKPDDARKELKSWDGR